MDFPMIVKYGWSIVYIEGLQVIISKKCYISQKIDFVLANSADPDETLHDLAFHQGLHCMPNYPLEGLPVQSSKGY